MRMCGDACIRVSAVEVLATDSRDRETAGKKGDEGIKGRQQVKQVQEGKQRVKKKRHLTLGLSLPSAMILVMISVMIPVMQTQVQTHSKSNHLLTCFVPRDDNDPHSQSLHSSSWTGSLTLCV